MPDIYHDFPIDASPDRVFDAVSLPEGLDTWWTDSSAGVPASGNRYELDFGPGYVWGALVTRCEPGEAFELALTSADPDWTGTRVGFRLEAKGDKTVVRFHHSGWREGNQHYRTSSFCWAMYLRLLKRYVETGEVVPYAARLDA